MLTIIKLKSLFIQFYKFHNLTDFDYTWTNNSYCPSFYKIQKYSNLYEALEACSSNGSCRSIVDYDCDSHEFWTCSEDILSSGIGSCTWTSKRRGMKDDNMSA